MAEGFSFDPTGGGRFSGAEHLTPYSPEMVRLSVENFFKKLEKNERESREKLEHLIAEGTREREEKEKFERAEREKALAEEWEKRMAENTPEAEKAKREKIRFTIEYFCETGGLLEIRPEIKHELGIFLGYANQGVGSVQPIVIKSKEKK